MPPQDSKRCRQDKVRKNEPPKKKNHPKTKSLKLKYPFFPTLFQLEKFHLSRQDRKGFRSVPHEIRTVKDELPKKRNG